MGDLAVGCFAIAIGLCVSQWGENKDLIAGALRLEAGQHEGAEVKVTPRWDMATLPQVGANA